jgi:biopolymer transport protein ExbB
MFSGKEWRITGTRRWHRLAILLTMSGLLVSGYLTVGAMPSFAYQDEEVEQVDGPAPAGADDKEDEDEALAKADNFLVVMIKANGYVFGPLLLAMSFIMVALVMMNILQVRRDNLLPAAFVESFEQRLAAKDYQGAYETAKSDDSVVARILAAGLSKLNRGYPEAIEGMQEVGEDENMALEHRLSYLALIGSIAPMVGLAGTVYGMIGAFESIAQSEVQVKPKELAADIYTALFTTLEGLAIAIPAMVFYSLLRNRVARLVLEIGIVSEGLMSRFATVGKRPGGGSTTATAPATPTE